MDWLTNIAVVGVGGLFAYFGIRFKLIKNKISRMEQANSDRQQAESVHLAVAKARLDVVTEQAEHDKAPDIKNRTDFENLK